MFENSYRDRQRSCLGRLLALVLVCVVSIAAGGQINGWWEIAVRRGDGPPEPVEDGSSGTQAAAGVAPATTVASPQPTPLASEPETVRAPAFALPDLLDPQAAVDLTDYAGQPVILNFWASWCLPCREEMPALQRVYLAYQQQGLIVLGVNQLYQDDLDAAQGFVKELGLTFPQAADGTGQVSEYVYGIIGLPTSVFIAASGEIAYRRVEQMSEAEIERYSEQLINEGTFTPLREQARSMGKRLKYGILILVLVQVGLIMGVLVLPPLVRALPGELRVRLARMPVAQVLLESSSTPLPTALPAPALAEGRRRVTIPVQATATASLVPTTVVATAQAGAEPGDVEPAATAPAKATVTAAATATPRPLPPQARVEGLEIIAQGFNNCGPANLTINLNFYGNMTTQSEAAAFLKPNSEDRNVSPWQMVDYVNQQTDLRAFVGSGGDLDLIKRFLANGLPIVIEKGYEPSQEEGWLGHYLTMFAYDDETQEFLSLDTNLGPWDGSGRVDSYETIDHYWQQFNYTFFVVYPPEKEALVLELLGEAMVDTASMWRSAAERAQAEIEADPENAFAWFNLGTSLTRLGEMTGNNAYYENGAAAFDEARVLGVPPRIVWYQFRPYIAYMKIGRYQDMIDLADVTLSTQGGRNVEETYLYRGHALAFLGDGPGAVEAYRQALKLNENFYPAQWALDAITGGG